MYIQPRDSATFSGSEYDPYWNRRHSPTFASDKRDNVTFGGFTAGELATTGVVSYAIVRLLGASVPGAIVMSIGNILWEGGSSKIAPGWKRYVLGLFRKPHS